MADIKTDDQRNPKQQYTILLAPDNKNSVLAEATNGITSRISYSPYGHQSAQQIPVTHLGFKGELREAKVGWYHLGKGYRVYNPRLMRFHSPDNWSPFGAGGLNAYMYCGGEPIMRSDPTGHAFGFLGFFDDILISFRKVATRPAVAAPAHSDLLPVTTTAANSISTRTGTLTHPISTAIGAVPTNIESAVTTLNDNMRAMLSRIKLNTPITTDTFKNIGTRLRTTLDTNALILSNQTSVPTVPLNALREQAGLIMMTIRGGMEHPPLYVNPPVVVVTPPTPPPPRRPPRSGG